MVCDIDRGRGWYRGASARSGESKKHRRHLLPLRTSRIISRGGGVSKNRVLFRMWGSI
jgi:hypothetical protein